MKPAAADIDTATPVPVAVSVLSARAVSLTLPKASTSLSSILTLTVPLSDVVASANEIESASAPPAEMAPLTLTATTSFVRIVSSVAVNKTEPSVASTSESAVIDASTRLVEVMLEMAPAAATAPLIAPEPLKATPTPTPNTSTKPVESAVSVTLPVVAVTSEPEIAEQALVPKFTSAIDSAKETLIATPPAPPMETEAASRVASIVAPSVALRLTDSASTTDPSTILASTILVSVFIAMTALPDALTDIAPAPPADSAAATPVAVMLMLSVKPALMLDADTVIAPAVSTSDAAMVASRLPLMVFLAVVTATDTFTDSPPAPPAPTATDVRTAKMSDRS